MSDWTKVVSDKISYLENKLSQGLTNISKQFSEQLKTIESKLADAPVAMDQETSQSQLKPVLLRHSQVIGVHIRNLLNWHTGLLLLPS